MSVEELVVYLIVALLCGLLGQAIAGRSLGGFIVSTVVGLIGAMLGKAIAHALGIPEPFTISVGGRSIPILWSIVGAALLTVVISQLRGRSGGRAASY